MYVKSFYSSRDITRIMISLHDVKAGLEQTTIHSVTVSDQRQINRIVDTLRQRSVIRTMSRPSWIPVDASTNDRLELTLSLVTKDNGILEYRLTSEGRVEVRKGSDSFAKAIVLHGSAVSWFEQVKKVLTNKRRMEQRSHSRQARREPEQSCSELPLLFHIPNNGIQNSCGIHLRHQLAVRLFGLLLEYSRRHGTPVIFHLT